MSRELKDELFIPAIRNTHGPHSSCLSRCSCLYSCNTNQVSPRLSRHKKLWLLPLKSPKTYHREVQGYYIRLLTPLEIW